MAGISALRLPMIEDTPQLLPDVTAILRVSATRNVPECWRDAVDMGMVLHCLAPAVQQCKTADLDAEMARIGSHDARRVRGGPEPNGVDRRLVLEGDGARWRQQGEDHVELRHGQQFHQSRRNPRLPRRTLTFEPVPAAAKVWSGRLWRCAYVNASPDRERTMMQMLASNLGKLPFHNHGVDAHCVLVLRKMNRAMAAEDVHHLEIANHICGASDRWDHRELQHLQRALYPANEALRNMGVACRSRQLRVAQQHQDHPDVDAALH